MDYVNNFLKEILLSGYSHHTITAYRNDLKIIEQKAINTITKEDVISFIPMDLAPRTRARRLNAFKSFFSWAKENNIVKSNPTKNIKAIKIPYSEVVIPCKDYKSLINNIAKEKHRLMLTLLRETGMRAGELAKLKKDSLIEAGLLIDGKGSKQRVIPLLEATRNELEDYLENMDQIYMFPNRKGERISNTTIYRVAKRYLGIYPHLLRHLFITSLIENNVDIFTAKTLAGHSNSSTTEVYTHLSKKHLAKSIEKTFE